MKVYQVVLHGVTDGRDSGYPTTSTVSPLFGTKKAAQTEADRLLARIRYGSKTIKVPSLHPLTCTYDFSNSVEKPLYEVVEVPVLSQAQADERIQSFKDDASTKAEAKAARLEAEAARIRAAWRDGYANV